MNSLTTLYFPNVTSSKPKLNSKFTDLKSHSKLFQSSREIFDFLSHDYKIKIIFYCIVYNANKHSFDHSMLNLSSVQLQFNNELVFIVGGRSHINSLVWNSLRFYDFLQMVKLSKIKSADVKHNLKGCSLKGNWNKTGEFR